MKIFYFGCARDTGHYLWDLEWRQVPQRLSPFHDRLYCALDGVFCYGLDGRRKELVEMPAQKLGEIRFKFADAIVRRMRKRKQKTEWYHRNKDWVRPKRNETRRELRAAQRKVKAL